MDNVPILEVYSGKCATHLGAKLKVVHRGKLTKKAQSGINLPHERLAHDHVRKGLRSGRGGGVAPMIRIDEPCSCDDGDGCPDGDPQFGWGPPRDAQVVFFGPRQVVGFVHVLVLPDSGGSPPLVSLTTPYMVIIMFAYIVVNMLAYMMVITYI